ncbi:MAG: FtsX-like permease family protein [Romboutsia sp.]
MKSILNKDIIRDIKKTKGRFLSILCIVALGVAFFSGIKVGPIVMKNTSDKYFDDYNLMDIRVLSTLGLTDDDVDAVKKITGVEGIFPTYSTDVITNYNSKESTLRVHSIPLDYIKNNSKDYINQVNLIEGRLPQNSGEVVIESPKINNLEIPIGSKINLKSGTDDDIKNTLKTNEYEVVGYIETPYYLSYEKGSSDIGSGRVEAVAIILQEDFNMEAYTEMFVTVKGTKEKNSYNDDYFDVVDKVSEEIENISDARIQVRHDEVVGSAKEELEKGKNEFKDKKKEVDEKLDSASKDIEKFTIQISDAENLIKSKKKQAEIEINNGKVEIKNGEKALNDGYAKYENSKNQFYKNKPEIETKIKEAENNLNGVNTQIQGIKSEISILEDSLQRENLTKEEKDSTNEKINEKKNILSKVNSNYEHGKKELESKKQELKKGENTLTSIKIFLDNNKSKLEAQKLNLVKIESKTKDELNKAEVELKTQNKKIDNAKIELKNSKAEAESELEKAKKRIEDSEDEINKIEKPEWYVLDRNSHYSYAQYENSANSIDALAKIFPVFFFSVAALVCLTTMTRMVDEQRINIGTLKALGYSEGKISKKYIIYALSASLLGSMLGLAIGFTIFPIVIFNAYGIMYTLPSAILTFDVTIAIGVTLLAVGITTLSAYLACHKELKETPSILMRPRAPKNGKRIILERMPFIWNKISFIGKVTIRNIFRYKKRFFMTVLGISGCTALILTGLGIRDSIQMIVDGQYGSLFKYDMTVVLDNDLLNSDIDKISDYISNDKRILKHQFINNENGNIVIDKTEKDITIVVPDSISNMEEFIHLRDRKSQDPIKLDDSGVVISEKIARTLDIKVGDNIELKNSKDKKVKVLVTGITENYISHYAYISPKYYKEVFGRDTEFNMAIGTVKDISNDKESKLGSDLMENDLIKGVTFNSGARENFSNTIKSLNYVVLLMTVSAGILAFIVLYNLTNVNISERIREIATIKVLGFYDNEVSSYIYRENIILTIIGTFAGLGLGKILHQFIMVTVELDSMMFGRVISFKSYVIAAVLTVALGIIVNLAMYYKLKTVKMVESLKSVD